MSTATSHPVSRTLSTVRSIVALYRDRDVPFLAGSVAYAAFVSLIPLVLLLLIVATWVGGESFRQYAMSLAEQYLTPSALGVVEEAVTASADQVGFSVFGGVALLWAVLKVFRTLDRAFSDLYRDEIDVSLFEQIRNGLVVLAAMTVAILAMVGVGTLVALAGSLSLDGLGGLSTLDPSVVRVLSIVALVVGLTVAFLPMYYVFPNADVSVREIIPGAFLAAVGWTVLQGLFQVYVSMTSTSELYGVIGGVILLITWLYFASVVVLLGGATNVVLAGRERALAGASPEDTPSRA